MTADATPYPDQTRPSDPGRASRFARISLLAVAGVLAVVLILLIWNHQRTIAATTQAAFAEAEAQVTAAADELDAIFGSAMMLTEALADDLSTGALPFDNAAIEERLRAQLDARPDLDGITVAFGPDVFPGADGLHLIYVHRDENGEATAQIGASRYDYTVPAADEPGAPQTDWYLEPIANGPIWQDPFLATGAGKVLVEYGAPFFLPDSDGQVAGVVAQDYTLEEINLLVEELDLGQTGFGLLFSQSGTWLAHPIAELVATSTFYESPQFMADPTLMEAAESGLRGESVAFERIEPMGETVVWDFVRPVESTGWALAVELARSEYLLDATIRLRQLTQILLVGGLLLTMIVAIITRADRASVSSLWITSSAYAIVMTLIIIATIILSRVYISQSGIAITNQSTLTGYLENLDQRNAEIGQETPVRIPTGVLLQAARFPDSTSIVVNGFVWQRVPKMAGEPLAEGFTLPQLIDEPMQIEEVHREEREDETLIVWAVNAALRQDFNPVKYPFDRHDITVRLMPAELERTALLVPDFSAYDFTAPGLRPGLDSTVNIRDWTILGAAFRFQDIRYGTNLGVPGRTLRDVPELSYSINAQRRFLGPFIAFLLPALVAAMMIFAFVLGDRKPDEPEEIVTALTYTAALFFVIAVMHTALRESAAAIGLTYLEYFYLLLYVMIVFVAVNTFIIVHRPNHPIVRFGNNLIAKALFWPTILTAMLIATFVIFA